jgi:hypothetical protein
MSLQSAFGIQLSACILAKYKSGGAFANWSGTLSDGVLIFSAWFVG